MPPPDFLDALVADLAPVRPAAPWSRIMLVWLLMSWGIVGAAILASGPLRPGILNEIAHSPRFGAEMLLGLAAGLATIWAGLELGVPGGPSASRLSYPPAIAFVAWTVLVAYGVFNPSTPPDMSGKRGDCFIQIILISLPPLILAIHFLRDRVLYSVFAAGLFVGVAAAALPVLWMHIACQTGSVHVLTHHFPPMLILGGLGAVVANFLLRRT